MEDNQIQKEIQSQNQLSNDEIISWGQLLSEAKDTLTKANVPDADIDAWLLMEHCFSITKSFFFLNRRQIVESKEKIKQYREFIKQRAASFLMFGVLLNVSEMSSYLLANLLILFHFFSWTCEIVSGFVCLAAVGAAR